MNESSEPSDGSVKKEAVITAIVFLNIGFLAGYVYHAEKVMNQTAPGIAVHQTGPSGGAPGAVSATTAGGVALPPGHPPIDKRALMRFWEDQAAQNPKDPAPRVNLANWLFDQRQFRQAAEWYQKALALDPTDVNARTDLGTCYFNLGRPDRALEEFRQSLRVNPRHEPTLYNIVVVNLDSHRDLVAAERAWRELHELNPDYPNLDRLRQELDAARGKAGREF